MEGIRLGSKCGPPVCLPAIQMGNSRIVEIPEDCKVGRQQCPLLRLHMCLGYCNSADWENDGWRGREELRVSGTIWLLLDLDKGVLSVFANGRRLGAMKVDRAANTACLSLSAQTARST